MPQRKRHGSNGPCLKIGVPPEACYIRFGGRTHVVEHSDTPGIRTVRGDTVVLDYDADGRLLGIELIGDNKPCQIAAQQEGK